MEQPTLEQQREYVRIWKENAKILEQIKKEELRAMTEEEACRSVDCVLDAMRPQDAWRSDPKSSGLVEQQRYFMKARG
jgi:hypothetical protein